MSVSLDRNQTIADWLHQLSYQLEALLDGNRHVRRLGCVDVDPLPPGLTDGADGEYWHERAAVEFTLVVRVEPGQEYAAANEIVALAHHVRRGMELTK